MKQFDLKLAKKGESVITRCSLIAKFTTESYVGEPRYKFTIYDKYDNFIMDGWFNDEGKYFEKLDSEFDLFMAEEAEESDFHPKDNNVYYRGDEERNNEIIADLEKRGGKNVDNYTAAIRDNIYFINQFGLIDVVGYDDVKDSLDGWIELHLSSKKVRKEGWTIIFKSEHNSIRSLFGIYDSESEAKEAAKKLGNQVEVLNTVKIDWEE